MNNIKNKKRYGFLTKGLITVVCGTLFFSACSDSFLEPDPLSFFEPGNTYTTESGVLATLATADVQFRNYWMDGESGRLALMYRLSDLAVGGKTDDSNMFTDVNGTLTPTNMRDNTNWFWGDVYYTGVTSANAVISYIDKIESMDEATRNAYKGMAYFHRAFRYYNLVFIFRDVPLVTKVAEVPKINYKSTKREAILDMLINDLEFAVKWVPEQKDLPYIGMINKGACQMLLVKCYLGKGEFQKAKDLADVLIDQSGYALMKESFGSFINSGEPETWPIDRNIIWDLHRPENKLINTNKEVIYGVVNRGTGKSFTNFETMRAFGPFWTSGVVKAPDNQSSGAVNYARTASQYNKKYDFVRAIGRGIANIRPSYFATHSLWHVNGKHDDGDLRHNVAVGNWFPMDSLKYNNPTSPYYGKSYAECPLIIEKDSIRTYFDFPLYKIYLKDVENENKPNEANFRGATLGSVSDWYIYRLAEAYLLRAEAKFYLGDASGAADDVNEVRKRAKCKELFTAVTIGDIMDERARELYLEEFRYVELSRVSCSLALSGKPDEWGNTYDYATYDKQSGTDLEGGSYWYQRVVRYNGYYNSGISYNANGRVFNYVVGKHNLYWPVPNNAITQNSQGQLSQNFGYDGYDDSTPKWEKWEDAVADEDRIN